MADTVALFSNYDLTASLTDQGRLVSFQQDWLGVLVSASGVSGGAAAVFRVQWSNDGAAWFDPTDTIGTVTAPSTLVGRFTVKAPYWRLVVTVTGTAPSVVCSASALF